MARLLKRDSRKRQMRIIVLSCVCFMFVLAIGYAAFSTKLSIGAKGNVKEVTAGNLGYVTDGLQVTFDSKVGLSGDKQYFKDISGKGVSGKLMGFDSPTFVDGGLDFDGTNDFVLLPEMNYDNVTMQMVVKYDKLSSTGYNYTFSNFETGGYGFLVEGPLNQNSFDIMINNHYLFYNTDAYTYKDSEGNSVPTVQLNKKYFLSGGFDGNSVVFYENNHKYSIDIAGTIKFPGNNTHMIIGGNPNGENLTSPGEFLPLDGQLYSIRIYDRALTDDEIMQNYLVDKERFGL